MDTNIFYVILAYINIPLGLSVGIWFIYKSFKQIDYVQRWNYVAIGVVNIYISVCYYLFVFCYNIATTQQSITSLLLRPANTLLLLIPFLIAYRRG